MKRFLADPVNLALVTLIVCGAIAFVLYARTRPDGAARIRWQQLSASGGIGSPAPCFQDRPPYLITCTPGAKPK